jgi:hypothetical protein
MKGIESGYLKTSPCAAFILATTMQTTLNITRKISIGIPIRIIHSGIVRTIYSSMESWKFIAAFPFVFTHSDSALRDIQQTSGPIIPPKGKKKPAKADK